MVNVCYLRAFTAVALLATFAACADQPTAPVQPDPEPTPAPTPLGLIKVTLSGLDGSGEGGLLSSTAVPVPMGPDLAMNPVVPDSLIKIELVSSSNFTEGTRGQGAQ